MYVSRSDCSTKVWTMVGLYIGAACLGVVVVAVFVDNVKEELIEKKAGVAEEV